MKRTLLTLFIAIFTINSQAQAQVQMKARASKTQLTTDDRLAVRFDVTIRGGGADINNFQPPKFDGFKVMGPSISEEYYNNNGKASSVYGYTYYLHPLKEGKYTIGKASITVEGKKYETLPIEIVVSKGKKPSVAQQEKEGSVNTPNGKSSEIFLVAEPTKTTPYVNEAVGLSYKLYFSNKLEVARYELVKQMKVNGFWVQTVDKTVSGPYQGTVNGKEYTYYVLNKKLLFPQHSGKLTINPLVLDIVIRKPVIRNYGFMRVQEYQMEKIRVSAAKRVLNVKELPQEQKPADFSGAVGNFSFKVTINTSQVKVGEPVNVSVIAKGRGNFKLFDLPKLKVPDGLELYDPKHVEQLQTTYSGNNGMVRDDYIVVPNSPGKYIIPGMRFVYFDPKNNNYEVRATDDIVLFVTGEGNYVNKASNTPVNNQKLAGKDFRFIKTDTQFTTPEKKDFFGSKTFEILLGIPFLLAFFLFGYHKYQSNKVYDGDAVKQKKSKSLAQKFLKDAKKTIGNKELFYANLEKAFHNFLKANLKIDTSEMSRDNIKSILRQRSVSDDKINDLFGILNKCDMARYTPLSTHNMEEDYAEATKVMNKLFEK
jgi:hypothetical protein